MASPFSAAFFFNRMVIVVPLPFSLSIFIAAPAIISSRFFTLAIPTCAVPSSFNVSAGSNPAPSSFTHIVVIPFEEKEECVQENGNVS